MRVQSITQVNTKQQQNPYIMQNTGAMITGKSASLTSFEECLNSQIQDLRALKTTRNAEWQKGNILLGFHFSQGMSLRPELKTRARADKSLSDL